MLECVKGTLRGEKIIFALAVNQKSVPEYGWIKCNYKNRKIMDLYRERG